MIRATTPTHIFTFSEDVPVAGNQKILVTYKQGDRIVLEKNKEDLMIDIENNQVSVELTQQEMNKFCPGVALIQIRVKNGDGKVLASQILKIKVNQVLDQEVL